jgi:hypothetical protein
MNRTSVISRREVLTALMATTLAIVPGAAHAQSDSACHVICGPTLALNVISNTSHVLGKPKVRSLSTGLVHELPSKTNLELQLFVSANTVVPRTLVYVTAQWLPTAKATANPFTEYTASEIGESTITANIPSLSFGAQGVAIDSKMTHGYFTLAGYVGDLFSQAARPTDERAFTHKLDIGAAATINPFASLPKTSALHSVYALVVLDAVMSGLPKAGDEVPNGERVFVTSAHNESLLLGLGAPIFPWF